MIHLQLFDENEVAMSLDQMKFNWQSLFLVSSTPDEHIVRKGSVK